MLVFEKWFGYNQQSERRIRKASEAIRGNQKLRYLFYRNLLKRKNHIILGESIQLGKNIVFPHPQNIVIGVGSVIGDNCIIYHDVTFGKKDGGYPSLGNGVVVYPGAKIIGNVVIGDDAVIGANAVVVKDVPPNTIVGGVPAAVIRERRDDETFR